MRLPCRVSPKAIWFCLSIRRRAMRKSKLLLPLAAVAAVSAVVWGSRRVPRITAGDPRAEIPAASVKKGAVTIVVAARGELQGGNSEVLTAPMTGGGDMAIIFLREQGEPIKEGDVIAQFDT